MVETLRMEQGSLSLKYLQLKDYAKENLTRPNSSDATAALLARDLPSTQRPPRRWASSCVADRVRGFESFRPRADVRALARAQSQNGLTAQAGPLQGTPQARFVESAAVPSSGPTAARCASWTSLGPRDKLLQENGGAAAHEGTTYHLDRGPPDPQSQPQARMGHLRSFPPSRGSDRTRPASLRLGGSTAVCRCRTFSGRPLEVSFKSSRR
uniref:Uncharacterized protein n=1 Tax=Tetraselmis sp. GSL018 TaxID=582737 RepID=A0A061R581_9CHLO|mmetsp:Transcript_955/g.2269  ORF Transcript_955/g.2269 Transcript_955/m.2269 type:complete len:211 (+) Transcript_955:569-1201(+)